MKNIYLVIRHPMRNQRFVLGKYPSDFYEIVKVLYDHKSAKLFCETKNKNLNTKYHYAVKILRVE